MGWHFHLSVEDRGVEWELPIFAHVLRSATLWLVHILVSIFWGTWVLAGVQMWCLPSTAWLGLTTAALTCCCDLAAALRTRFEKAVVDSGRPARGVLQLSSSLVTSAKIRLAVIFGPRIRQTCVKRCSWNTHTLVTSLMFCFIDESWSNRTPRSRTTLTGLMTALSTTSSRFTASISFRLMLVPNQISSVFIGLSWSLLDAHNLMIPSTRSCGWLIEVLMSIISTPSTSYVSA